MNEMKKKVLLSLFTLRRRVHESIIAMLGHTLSVTRFLIQFSQLAMSIKLSSPNVLSIHRVITVAIEFIAQMLGKLQTQKEIQTVAKGFIELLVGEMQINKEVRAVATGFVDYDGELF